MEYLRGESLRPQKWADGYVNDSPVSVLHGAYKRIRRFGRGDMYMGRWDAAKGKAVRIGRDVEDDLYQKFLAGDLGNDNPAESASESDATQPAPGSDPLAPAAFANAPPGAQVPAASHPVRLLLVLLLLLGGHQLTRWRKRSR